MAYRKFVNRLMKDDTWKSLNEVEKLHMDVKDLRNYIQHAVKLDIFNKNANIAVNTRPYVGPSKAILTQVMERLGIEKFVGFKGEYNGKLFNRNLH